jgi:hypothetical protein
MSAICSEHEEWKCGNYPHLCYGCNAFANPTNFDRIKYEVLRMDMEKFIEFCGGNNCGNIICSEIPMKYAYCYNGNARDCGKCIREYLERKPE